MIHDERFVEDVGGDAVMVIALFILFVFEVIWMFGSCGGCWGRWIVLVGVAGDCWAYSGQGLLEVTGLCCCCWECWFFT